MEINYKFWLFLSVSVLTISIILNVYVYSNKGQINVSSVFIETVSAAEIYPMFFCPCCGQPLDKQNICCGQAQERIDYIDSLVEKKFSEKEIILNYVKNFGLDSFVDKIKQEEFREELAMSAPADRPVISLNIDSIDLGDVSQKNGVATAFFEIRNTGEQDLIINKLDTSCGCTSASLVFNGSESPKFAMAGHGAENPADWQANIPAGASAQLKVYYDPSVHLDLQGPVIREIYIYSNDPIDFQKKVQIELNQIN